MSNDTPEILISFPGGKRVNADFFGRVIETDQSPRAGGDGSAPEPFALFLASIGTCSAYYVGKFCRSRDIPTDGIRLELRRILYPESKMIERIDIDIQLPEGFPEKYRGAVVRAAKQCTVKKHLDQPPVIEVEAVFPAD